MTNPLTYGTLTVMPCGPSQSPDNITSLASNTSKALGVLDFSSAPNYDCNVPPIKIKSGAASVSATGTLTVYVITSEDNTVWTDAISPTSTSDQTSAIATALAVCQIGVVANATTYYTPEFSLVSVLGYMPKYAAVLIRNQSGAALDGTAGSFYAKYLPITYT